MLHVNLPRWRNLIGSLSRDIGQYPRIEISNSGYCFHRKMSPLCLLIKNKQITEKSVILFIVGVFTCLEPLHLRQIIVKHRRSDTIRFKILDYRMRSYPLAAARSHSAPLSPQPRARPTTLRPSCSARTTSARSAGPSATAPTPTRPWPSRTTATPTFASPTTAPAPLTTCTAASTTRCTWWPTTTCAPARPATARPYAWVSLQGGDGGETGPGSLDIGLGHSSGSGCDFDFSVKRSHS